MKSIRLKEGKERSLLRRHPWVFESAIAKGGADAGETVRVEGHDGRFLCWAAFSPASRTAFDSRNFAAPCPFTIGVSECQTASA